MRPAAASVRPGDPEASGAPAFHRPLRIAHRGASAHAPENTLPAFEEARRLGVDLIEFDVHLSADGVPVVIHDDTVDRTTDGHGAVVALRFAELRRLDAGSWFGRGFRGARVPSLEETLDWARGRTGVNIEIKADRPGAGGGSSRRALASLGRAEALARSVARALQRSEFRERAIVSSFDRRALVLARAVMPRVPLGLLASRSARGLLSLHRRLGLYAFHPHHRLASARRIAAAHRIGLFAFVWPVNTIVLMRRLLARQADGLMTDDPALFRRL